MLWTKENIKLLDSNNVGTSNWLFSVQIHTKYSITIRGSIGLPITDDNIKVKELRAILYILFSNELPMRKFSIGSDSESQKKKNLARGYYSVKTNNFTLFWYNVYPQYTLSVS